MSHPPMIYGLGAPASAEPIEIEYAGAEGTLPGAAAFSAGVLFNTIALDSEEVIFENGGVATGWSLRCAQSAADPRVIVATLSFGVVGALTDIITVPIGACSNEWLFVAFTVDAEDAVVVYVNGEVAYTTALNGAVIPSVGAPLLEYETGVSGTALSWAFYTETALIAPVVAKLSAQLKKNAGTIDWDAINAGVIFLQHIYSATESMRPLVSTTWTDTGLTPTVNLTLGEGTPVARVLPGDFSQAVIGAIVDPEGPATP